MDIDGGRGRAVQPGGFEDPGLLMAAVVDDDLLPSRQVPVRRPRRSAWGRCRRPCAGRPGWPWPTTEHADVAGPSPSAWTSMLAHRGGRARPGPGPDLRRKRAASGTPSDSASELTPYAQCRDRRRRPHPGGPPRRPPLGLARHRPGRPAAGSPAGPQRPGSLPGGGRRHGLHDDGRGAGHEHRPQRRPGGGVSRVGPRHHGRPPVRLGPAGDPLRRPGRHGRRHGRGHRGGRGVDEPGAHRVDDRARAGRGLWAALPRALRSSSTRASARRRSLDAGRSPARTWTRSRCARTSGRRWPQDEGRFADEIVPLEARVHPDVPGAADVQRAARCGRGGAPRHLAREAGQPRSRRSQRRGP